MDGRLDRLYRRYCAHGDLRALARLFDLAAPQLHAVARHLCGDEAEAEDAVQATFVTLIAKRAQFDRQRRFTPWALGILSKHAAAARRQAERAPDPDRVELRAGDEPSVALERAELGREVEAHIAALPALYADAVRAHLVEGVGPREIGARLAITPGAASVRVHRGLRLLRKLLPPGFATGWLAVRPARGLPALRASVLREAATAVVPSSAAGLSLGVLTGGILMKKLALTALALVAALVVWVVLREPVAPSSGTPEETVVTPSQALAPPEPAALRTSGERTERTEVVAPPPKAGALVPTTGTVFVRVTHERDGAPAAGVGLVLRDGQREDRELTTDDEGVARFEAVAPGRCRLRLDRARTTERFELAAGAEASVELELPPAIEVTGTVVDREGEPVPGATVLLAAPADVGSARGVATTDEDGRFELSSIHPDCELGARASGHAPSAMRALSQPGAEKAGKLEVTIRLPAAGGALRGRVLDHDGQPVAGAWLQIGGFQGGFSMQTQAFSRPAEVAPDGSWSMPAVPLQVRTDSEGAFACEGVELGDVPVRVRAPREGLTSWNGTVRTEADETVWLEVRLPRGATVHGQVTTDDGAPVAGVSIEAWGPDPSLFRRGRTNTDGHYRVERIVPGKVELRVNRNRSHELGAQPATFELADGSALEWDVTLSGAPAIAGRVIDEAGNPLADWRVAAYLEGVSFAQRSHDVTDAGGRFRIDGCADESHTLELRRLDDDGLEPPRGWRQGVRPGGPELELVGQTGPDARVRCAFVDPAGEPAGEVRLWATMQPIGRYVTADAELETGAVEIEGLPAGLYHLAALSPDFPNHQLGEHELRAGETLDLGTIRFAEPARLLVQVSGPDGAAPEGLEVELRKGAGGQTTVPLALEAPGRARSGPAPPGAYEVRLRAPGCGSARRLVELEEGEQRVLEVALVAGVECRFDLTTAPGNTPARWVALELLTPDGALHLSGYVFDAERPAQLVHAERLAPGRYLLRAHTSDPPLSGELELEVPDVDGEARFSVRLQP